MALQSSKVDLAGTLKGASVTTASRGQSRTRGALVIGQIATALVLLVGALLLVKSLDRLLQVNPGFQPEHVLTMQIALPSIKYSPTHTESEFYRPLLENVRRIPGVQATGLISELPIQGGTTNSFQVGGRPQVSPSEEPFAEARAASPDYFGALGIPLIRGRYLTEHDDVDAPLVVVINKALADQYFPNEDPLGKRLLFDLNLKTSVPLSIVGVVGSTRQHGLAEPPGPEMDISFLQAPKMGPLATRFWVQTMSLVVRTTGDPTAVASAVREAVLNVDPDQPVFDVNTMEEVISTSLNSRRFDLLLLGSFAALGLVLAVLGIYGVISYGVQQRTHEVGIRMALGAQRRDVLQIVLGEGAKLALIGVAIGLVAALGLTRLLRGLLYAVSATDPATFVGAAILLTAVALLACYIPARRATKIDPMVALRHE